MSSDTQDNSPGADLTPQMDPQQEPLHSDELEGDIDEPGKGGDTVNPGKDGGDEFPDGREDFDNPGQSPSELPSQPVPELPNLPPD
ncbi:MAG: hypothetical protein WA957_08360 [Alteraurantiacibacter sp.]